MQRAPGEKLRQHGVAGSHLYVGLETAEHRTDLPQYSPGTTIRFVEPTSDTLILCEAASSGLRRIWRDGYSYYRAGVLMDDLVSAQDTPRAWVVQHDRARRERLMEALDGLNARYGRRTVFPAGAGVRQGWTTRADRRSRHFTTRLENCPSHAHTRNRYSPEPRRPTLDKFSLFVHVIFVAACNQTQPVAANHCQETVKGAETNNVFMRGVVKRTLKPLG